MFFIFFGLFACCGSFGAGIFVIKEDEIIVFMMYILRKL